MTTEARLTQMIVAELRRHGAWVVKYHVGPYGHAGVPDLLVCYRGQFIALEVKIPGRKPTPLQERTLQQIRLAGGRAAVVSSVDDVWAMY